MHIGKFIKCDRGETSYDLRWHTDADCSRVYDLILSSRDNKKNCMTTVRQTTWACCSLHAIGRQKLDAHSALWSTDRAVFFRVYNTVTVLKHIHSCPLVGRINDNDNDDFFY